MIWKNKKVAILGAKGMIGSELVILLKKIKAQVYEYDLKNGYDLTDYNTCLKITKNKDFVFSLVGQKGNPKMTSEKPLDFMFPMLRADVNIIKACIDNKVKNFLYTSSIAVENKTTDKFPAHAKLTGEIILEAAKNQYPWFNSVIVRPCNVYGRFDNLEAKERMVISDLIRKGIKNKKIEVWNNGGGIRDFINAKDCAKGMIQAMEQMPEYPVNLCSGTGISIKKVANIISKELNVPVEFGKDIDTSKRVMKLNWNFNPEIKIEDGIKEVINHVRK